MGRRRAHGKAERALRPARRRPAGRTGDAVHRAEGDASRRATMTRCAPAWSGCGPERRRASSATRPGLALEDKLAPLRVAPPAETRRPCSGSACSRGSEAVDAESLLPDGAGAWAGPARPLISRAEYETALAAVKTHIEAGDIYQANLTFAASVRDRGPPARALRGAARAGARPAMARIVFTGDALDPQPLAGTVLHARGGPHHRQADEGHRAARRRPRRASPPTPSSAPKI